MPAYLLFLREGAVKDPAKFMDYQMAMQANGPKVKMNPLVVYGATTPLEGEAPDGVVLLQFDTVDDAKAWYHSAEYQAAIQHRFKAADYRVMIIEGFTMPAQ
jgi:uncharacterized protein (DUF1330 family)